MLITVEDEMLPRTDFMKYSNSELCPKFNLHRSDSEAKIYKLNAHLVIKDIIAFVKLLDNGIEFKPPSLDFINIESIDRRDTLLSCLSQYILYVINTSSDEKSRCVRTVIEEEIGEEETRKIIRDIQR
tara:strand:+ start:336 stop:719 length:384 start_codon:yes stop_codon:yes gene_type:complete